MKQLTVFLLALALAAGGVCLWQWTHAELAVVGQTVQTIPAATEEKSFESLMRDVRRGSLQGVVYHRDLGEDISRCAFQYFTLTVENRGLLPAEMTELQLTPFGGDICAYLPGEEAVIPPGSRAEVRLTLLTESPAPVVRDVIITCYIWGHLIRQRVTLTQNDYLGGAYRDTEKGSLWDLLIPAARAEEEDALPEGFVHVRDLIPDCVEQMRYAGEENFVGQVIDGYLAPAAILTKEAAQALEKAAALAREKGYRLLIFDAYRPQRAVAHFWRWAKDAEDTKTQANYYPGIDDKRDLLKKGYIAMRSGHSRGSTVDLTLADGQGEPLPMGTDFDFFGPRAAHGAKGLTAQERANRRLLKRIMEQAGFRAYEAEWWHYTLKNEPCPDTYFDFPVR